MKNKLVVMSFDDGELQDIRLTELLRKYGLTASFGFCSGYVGRCGLLKNQPGRTIWRKIPEEKLCEVYNGFEMCSHGVYHRDFKDLSFDELYKEVDGDRKFIEKIFGIDCRGAIYPGGSCDIQTAENLKKIGIEYARTIKETYNFEPPENPLIWNITCSMRNKDINMLFDRFIDLKTDDIKIFNVYAHSYEFDIDKRMTWNWLEVFFEKISGEDSVRTVTFGECMSIISKACK